MEGTVTGTIRPAAPSDSDAAAMVYLDIHGWHGVYSVLVDRKDIAAGTVPLAVPAAIPS